MISDWKASVKMVKISGPSERHKIGLFWLKLLSKMYYKCLKLDRNKSVWLYEQQIEPAIACMCCDELALFGVRPLQFPFLFGCRMFPVLQGELGTDDPIMFVKDYITEGGGKL